MPELTIGRMAKLYGLHRSTLYEAIEKGRVTTGVNGKGQRVIDLSEMIRRYGEPPGKKESTRQNPTPSIDTNPTPPTDTLQPLLDELRAMRELYRAGLEENRALRQEVRELKEVMLRLPSPQSMDTPPKQPESPPEGEQASTPTEHIPKGRISFADIEAKLAARIKGQS